MIEMVVLFVDYAKCVSNLHFVRIVFYVYYISFVF